MSVGKDVKELEPSCTTRDNNYFGKQFDSFLKS